MTDPVGRAVLAGTVGAVVLAGGTGRRLGGVSKADLRVRGERQLDRVLGALSSAGPVRSVHPVVVVGPVEVPPGVIRTQEDPPRSGPAAGLAAGLAALRASRPPGGPEVETVLVIACDLAEPAAGVARLLSQPVGGDGTCLADPDGRPQWLLGHYRRGALERALTDLGDPTGAPLHRVLGGLDLVVLPATEAETADLDTPDDLRRWTQDDDRSER